MKKDQVDLENWLVHIADSKTAAGIGDMPMIQAAREAFGRQREETPGSDYLFPSPKQQAAYDQSPENLGPGKNDVEETTPDGRSIRTMP